MKLFFWSLLLLSVLLIACSEQTGQSTPSDKMNVPLDIPKTIVSKSALQYDPQTSMWTLDEAPFSGFAVSYYPDSSLMEKFGILDGVKQNKFTQWHPDGQLKNITHYHQGKLHGTKKVWSAGPEHILIAQYKFYQGKAHGEQKKWYPTGELFKKMNMNQGKEEGIQQAYRKNGVLYANYEAREGRIFGLKKAALCFGLEDENLQKDH